MKSCPDCQARARGQKTDSAKMLNVNAVLDRQSRQRVALEKIASIPYTGTTLDVDGLYLAREYAKDALK